MKDVSVSAVRAVRGLAHAGVDLLVDDFTSDTASVFVNELNPSAGLGGHLYPAHGLRRDVAASIVDEHFPLSVRIPGSGHWYFSLNQTVRMFSSRVASEVTLAPLPHYVNPRWRTIRVLGPAERLGTLRSEILGRLSRSHVNGRIGKTSDGFFDVYMAGDDTSVDAAEKIVRRLATAKQATVKPVSQRAFRAPVGFVP